MERQQPQGGPQPYIDPQSNGAPIPSSQMAKPLPPERINLEKQHYIALAFMLLVIVGGIVFYFGVKNRAGFDETKTPKTLSFDEVVFASIIDTSTPDYVYNIQPNAKYEIGDYAYIYIKITGFETQRIDDEYKIYLVEDLKVYDPSGNIVKAYDLPGFAKSDYQGKRLDEVEFSNKLPLYNDLQEGKYKAVIKINDLIGAREIEKEAYFILYKDENKIRLDQDLTGFEGEVNVQIAFFDNDGNELEELKTTSVLPNDALYFDISFPDQYPAGTYSAKIKLSDDEGNIKTETVNIEEKDELYIDSLIFAGFIDKDNKIYPIKNAEFESGYLMYIYFEVKDFKQDKSGEINFVQDIIIKNPNGKEVLNIEGFNEVTGIFEEEKSYFIVKNRLPISEEMEKGEYELTVIINDEIAKQTATRKEVFWII